MRKPFRQKKLEGKNGELLTNQNPSLVCVCPSVIVSVCMCDCVIVCAWRLRLAIQYSFSQHTATMVTQGYEVPWKQTERCLSTLTADHLAVALPHTDTHTQTHTHTHTHT